MKLILSRLYNSNFHESDLDYEKETKRFKSDIAYLHFRNALSSYNVYTIIEVLEDHPDQIVKCTTPILNFENWDNVIFNVGDYFIKRFQKTPQVMTANSVTLNRIDLVMGENLIKEGKEENYKTLTIFECSIFSLNICIDENLPDDYVSIIFDEQANFTSDEKLT